MKVKSYPLAFVGLLILVIGWFSIFTGVFGIAVAEDIRFFIEVENMVFVEQVITAEEMVVHMIVRVVLGFFLVLIGNSFLVRGIEEDHICHPRFGDFMGRRLS